MIAAIEPTQAPAGGAAPEETRIVVAQQVPLAEIVRSPFNRDRSAERKTEEWKEFVNSIRTHGIVQPLLGRPLPAALDPERKPGTPRIELVIGEGRWLGAREAELRTVPVIVRQLSDREAIELQTIENDKRKDLTPIQQAAKYQQLLEQYKKDGLTAEKAMAELCAKLSKSKSTVYETLRLLELAAPVQAAVNSGTLPASHAGLITKLPAEMQEVVSRAIAPGKELKPEEERGFEKIVGYVDIRDEDTGLVPFRETKEIIDSLLEDLKQAEKYEKVAAPFRAKGGTALTFLEWQAQRDDLARSDTYLNDGGFYGYVHALIKGVKELPKQIMAPSHGRPDQAEMVYRKSELIAALKKAGVKTRTDSSSGSSVNYAAMERRRKERERLNKAILKATIDPIRTAAMKRNAKVPWSLVIPAVASHSAGSKVCKARGWPCTYNNMRKVLATNLAKVPENQIAGVLAEILIDQTTIDYTGSYKPEFVALGQFYGIDVKKVEKEAKAKLAPVPAKKKPTTKKVQTPVKKRAPINAAGRKRLAEAMRARWAARRADAKKGSAK